MASEFRLTSHIEKTTRAVYRNPERVKGSLLQLSVHARNNDLIFVYPFENIIFKGSEGFLMPWNEVWKIYFQFLDRLLSQA